MNVVWDGECGIMGPHTAPKGKGTKAGWGEVARSATVRSPDTARDAASRRPPTALDIHHSTLPTTPDSPVLSILYTISAAAADARTHRRLRLSSLCRTTTSPRAVPRSHQKLPIPYPSGPGKHDDAATPPPPPTLPLCCGYHPCCCYMATANASLFAPKNPGTIPYPAQASLSAPSPPEPSASATAPSSAPAASGQRPPLLRSAYPNRLSPPCWGHDETLSLIEAYGAKWCELRRGNLRASHWQEVADAVRRRCQRLGAFKTAVQCRHKVEKLRQRYRAEKQRIALRGNANKPRFSSWAYFPRMDALEVGDTSTPGAVPSPSSDTDGDDGRSNSGGKTKNQQHTLQLGFNGLGGRDALEFRIPKASRSKVIGHHDGAAAAKAKPRNGWFFKGFSGAPRWSAAETMGKGGELRKKKKGALVWEMVAAVKMLGDEFTRVEEMKMEMVRDMEKLRREMELKRTELMAHSQRQLLDYVTGLHHHDTNRAAKGFHCNSGGYYSYNQEPTHSQERERREALPATAATVVCASPKPSPLPDGSHGRRGKTEQGKRRRCHLCLGGPPPAPTPVACAVVARSHRRRPISPSPLLLFARRRFLPWPLPLPALRGEPQPAALVLRRHRRLGVMPSSPATVAAAAPLSGRHQARSEEEEGGRPPPLLYFAQTKPGKSTEKWKEKKERRRK
ncbi:hypothetical protein Taro_012725 [Colocasia esculenta]|uniref:Myb/SANT-like DNA-binding domain-containing protein n=1 Tax=Colocasia esculenta TaxID=4460 RepID=A0A843U4Q1_COLES|nr:hypothetical protein [Colocasia esculenta]